MKLKFAIVLSVFFPVLSMAQETIKQETLPKTYQYFDVLFSYGQNNLLNTKTHGKQELAAVLAWNYLYRLDKKSMFKLGYGLRFTGLYGKQIIMNSLTPNSQSYLALDNTSSYSLNIILALQVTPIKNLDLGANIDLIGATIGPDQTGHSVSSAGAILSKDAAPTILNYIVGGKNDHGTLNSEIFVRYWFHKSMPAKAAFNHLISEYTLTLPPQNDAGRYRFEGNMLSIGLTFYPH